ncbi:winged helix-turn-helix transcriptional regulator [Streptomyces gamaensis]|uniref:Winged helix-turn-helix transcriptional regulator n=1 Tax=Streptomyces gamaensis TaxID=1763542 RepID=A0ABW0YRE9_9ACTN
MTGIHSVGERLRQLRYGATREVCALLTGRPWAAVTPAGAATAARVPLRIVVERAGPYARAGSAAGGIAFGGPALIRVVERVPAELVVADREIALLRLTPSAADGSSDGTTEDDTVHSEPQESQESLALAVRSGKLLASLVDLFEDVWQEALPLRVCADTGRRDGGAGPDATDLRILSLLLVGLTDASVARQLGLGLRTVQRRVKRLMELARVTTRLQLGWYAAECGWTAARGTP